ncbi:hypothetical protein Ciccas_000535 [Cichlidogyrus casuarinus]|uniref:Uncharacterized protein n=1 Tax=Cichlidogyrus casuarinus TaxID=1844966 RepID=A0ABD2QML8_9PLAT
MAAMFLSLDFCPFVSLLPCYLAAVDSNGTCSASNKTFNFFPEEDVLYLYGVADFSSPKTIFWDRNGEDELMKKVYLGGLISNYFLPHRTTSQLRKHKVYFNSRTDKHFSPICQVFTNLQNWNSNEERYEYLQSFTNDLTRKSLQFAELRILGTSTNPRKSPIH